MKKNKHEEVTNKELAENDAALIKKFGVDKFENDYEPHGKGLGYEIEYPDYMKDALEAAKKRQAEQSD